MRTLSGILCCVLAAQPLIAETQFNRDVRPILSDRCYTCHGPDAKAKGIRLRLDSEAAAKAALDGGERFAIVPGKPGESELFKRITAESPARRMPPAHTGLKLSAAEIETLRGWIEEGASWQKHWSFLPPVRPQPPAGLASHPVDAFVAERLRREGLRLSKTADRATLIRRASLDLTGLPPTLAEVDAFLAAGGTLESEKAAYAEAIDRLLASPHFGERFAARWLDAARYADTNGYQTDAERYMWRWRDWVIDALNRNMPYDQFVLEQVAGDLLPNATRDQIVATGFNRNHRGNSEGGIVPEEYLVEYAVDRSETAATVFLGLTIGCARCHNHKYDPFTQRDYYSLLAYFNNIPELGRYLKYGNTPPFLAAPTPEQDAQLRELEKRAAEAAERMADFEPALAREQSKWGAKLGGDADWAPGEALDTHAPLSGEAGKLDGTREVSLGDKGAFGYLSRFTLSAWVKPDGADGPILSRAVTTGDGEGYTLFLQGGRVQANLVRRPLDDSIRVETKAQLKNGEWQHVAVTYDGSRIAGGVHIYVNGGPQELNVILDAINQDFRVREPLRVGGGGNSGLRFRGAVEQVRLYSADLSPEQVGVLAVRRTVAEIASMPAGSRSAAESRKLRGAFLDLGAPPDIRAAWREVLRTRGELAAFEERIPTVMVMQESPNAKDTHILLRGAYDRPGAKVTRGVPEVLPPLPPGAPANRLGLAQWLVHPGNPLTARVAVNRFWQMLFGTGLVKTVEDFGSQGEWPSHPELLDWLASEFVSSGWDVKALLKTIVTSETYKQSSQVTQELLQRDPENRLLARGPKLRLPAEMVRDQALAVSGLLVRTIGGPSVKPYQPAGLWAELGDRDYERDHGAGLYRRSLYTYWKRTSPPPFMSTFDSALREACTVRESRTNTPLQALNLMNDVTFLEAARKMAERMLIEGGSTEAQRLTFGFRLALARAPRAVELAKLTQSLAFFQAHYRGNPGAAAEFLAQGESARDKSLAVSEHAAYAAVASLILNLDEMVSKP